jgi:deltex-like protein
VDTVLAEGLDERLGSSTGLLGRGIYFADSPSKAINYDSNGVILIFAVYLGDCLFVPPNPNYVREPQKTRAQQPNHGDLFFDSIVGRPAATANEFVIYDRNQCCPMYAVTYQRGTNHPFGFGPQNDRFSGARAQVPPFAWQTAGNSSGRILGDKWPFFARSIFNLMKTDEQQSPALPSITPAAPAQQQQQLLDPTMTDDEAMALKLSTLWDLGFTDDTFNTATLDQFGGNLERTIDFMLQRVASSAAGQLGSAPPTPFNQNANASSHGSTTSKIDKSISAAVAAAMENAKMKKGQSAAAAAAAPPSSSTSSAMLIDEPEKCPICLEPTTTNWTTLKCQHKLCTPCHSKMIKQGTTMSGSHHSWIKCPLCQSIDGVAIGDCPDGLMQTYPAFSGYIRIDYTVSHPKYGLNRTAYIEATLEGQRLLELLKIAWDRRLCFTIGTSLTTGQQDTLVWNIHHKTSLSGGEHGYPDPTYLFRLAEELRQYGIE